MRLKRIEIEGFKSFAERTVIELPEGMCAVVGPNGCGKSNLVDALRWVLGEQSPKALRARSMEEVIFAGSQNRRPAGAAEVTIVFENAQGLAPEPFRSLAEISITRRLLRSGESEYLINRSPCRLKDIRQLLMDTGLGNRAYAIIEQGRVAAFVEARPAERRIWIEEAAGITRYKDQRSASLRRMEATRANLARVEDILGEVAAQMRSLQRQATKARTHQELSAKIRELRLKIGSWQWHTLQEELAQLGHEISAAEAELAAAQTHEQALATRLEAARTALGEAAQVIDAHGQAKLELEGRIQRTENAHTLAGQQARSLIAQAKRLEQELAELRAQLSTMQGQMAAAERRALAAQRRQEQLDHQRHNLAHQIQKAQERLEDLEQKLELAREELVELLARQTQAEGRLEETSSSLQSLGNRIKRLLEHQEKLHLLRTQAQKRVASLQKEELRARQVHEQAQKQVAEATRRLQEAENLLEQARTREAAVSRELHELSARQEGLKIAVKEAKWAGQGPRKALEAAAHGELEAMGLVGQLIGAARGKEGIVAWALGEWAEAVVVATRVQARGLMDWAQRNGLKLRVVALEALADGPMPPADTEPVSQWVHTQKPLEALARLVDGVGWTGEPLNWLGRLEPGQRVVGEQIVVTSSGMEMPAGAAAAALEQANELKALEAELSSVQNKLDQAHKARVEAQAALAKARQQLQEARAAEAQARSRAGELGQALAQASQELKSHEAQLQTLTLEIEELQHQQQELEQRRVRLKQELEELSVTVPEAEAEMARLKDELAEVSSKLEELRAEEADLRVALAEAHSEATRHSQRHRRLAEELAKARRREQELSHAREQALNQAEALEARRRELEQSLAQMYEELKKQEEAYSHALDVRRELEEKLQNLQKELDQARTVRSEASAHLEKLRLTLEHRKDQLKQLLETYRDELRIELESYARANPPEDSFQPEQANRELERLRKRLVRLGPVNMTALEEYEAVAERHRFLSEQKADLEASLADLTQAMRRINRASRKRFTHTLEQLNARLAEVFPVLFGEGGKAMLVLEEGSDPLEAGVELMVQLPGKKVKHLEALSGGEKVMAAVAVLMALFLVRPAPVCVLDEVDAALDEVNTGRFIELLKELAGRCQLLTITHNRRTMEIMDVLYGVTMQEVGVSKVVMVSLEEGKALAAA